MSEEQSSIVVTIANRSYPLKVNSGQEEAIYKAAESINSKLKEFESAYSVRDHQDLLAMYTLQLMAEQMGVQQKHLHRESEIQLELERLTQLVKSFDSKVI